MRPQTPQKRIVTEVVTLGATSICPHFCPQSTGGGGNIKLPPPLSLFDAAYPAGAPAGVASRLGREATPVSTRAFALVPILELIMIIMFLIYLIWRQTISNQSPRQEQDFHNLNLTLPSTVRNTTDQRMGNACLAHPRQLLHFITQVLSLVRGLGVPVSSITPSTQNPASTSSPTYQNVSLPSKRNLLRKY